MSTWVFSKRKELGLSQGEVAAALGVSRPTYILIEKGERTPTPEQKAILAQILRTDEQKIEKYGKATPSLPAVSVRDVPQENVEKFKQTLLYVVNKVGNRPNIGQTALYKILYFIDFDYYEKFEEQLIGATYIKNTYGPTPVSFAKIVRNMERDGLLVEVKSKHFQYDQTKYVPAKEPIVSELSGQELQHIDEVIARLASKSARELSELSHIDTPWAVAKDKSVLNYEHVFYRPSETSVRDYDPL